MVSFQDGNLEIISREPEQKFNHGYTWRGIAATKNSLPQRRKDAKTQRNEKEYWDTDEH